MSNVVRTPLTFKDGGVTKKKSKKAKKVTVETPKQVAEIRKGSTSTGTKKKEEYVDKRTPAQKAHEEIMRKRHMEKLEKEEKPLSHKDRVQNLNNYLSTLSEHYDLPKVGPG